MLSRCADHRILALQTADLHLLLAGGLGLAAIQLAQAAGAVPVGTAGSTHKRGYMRSLGVADVASSRSTEFAEVLGPAHGQGPPRMVLNSLTSPGAQRAQRPSLVVIKVHPLARPSGPSCPVA